MFKNNMSKQIFFGLLVVCMGILAGTQFMDFAQAASLTTSEMVTQQNSSADAVSPETTTATKRFICQISEVDEWVDNGSSVLIGCNPGDGSIAFFAQSTADSKRAARILSIALTALALGKPIWIVYDPAATNVVGCGAGNCRMIYGMGMNK